MTFQWNESESGCNVLIVKRTGVIIDIDEFDCHGGDFSDHDSSQGIGKRKVDVVYDKDDFFFVEFEDFYINGTLREIHLIEDNLVFKFQGKIISF